MCVTMFDCDGPLAMCVEREFFSWANQQPFVAIKWQHHRLVETGDWEAVTGLPIEQTTDIFRQFMASASYPGLRPTPGAIAALRSVPARARYLATARGHSLASQTREFLTDHFGSFSGYSFGAHTSKIDLAKKIKPRAVVDDCYPLLCRIAHETDALPILFPKPVPRHLKYSNGVIVLAAESQIRPGLTDEEFAQICTQAWLEITDYLQS